MSAAHEQLKSRLKAVRRRLLFRAGVRAASMALGWASLAILAGALFLVVLPRLLWDGAPAPAIVLILGTMGAVFGVVRELRGFRVPGLPDAALAMEARLEHHSGALGLVLGLSPDDRFSAPVSGHAARDLDEAERATAPPVVTTRWLVWIPAVSLLAGLSLAYLFTLDSPESAPGPRTDGPEVAGGWNEIDTGGARSDADREAYRDALGMKESEASLRRSAATLRDSEASPSERETALDDARRVLDDTDAGDSASGELLPADVPAGEEARDDLAAKIEEAVSHIGAAADRRLNGAEGTRDTGREGEFEAGTEARELVPFPALEPVAADARPAEATALQTPARRALADRAVKAYERLQHP